MAEIVVGELAKELVKQLVQLSCKACKYKGKADNLATMIDSIQPTIMEIQGNGVELSSHRRVQLLMFTQTLEKCKNITEDVLKSKRWNVYQQLRLCQKMEKIEKRISSFVKGPLLIHILAEVHHLQAFCEVRFDRIDNNFDSMNEQMTDVVVNVHHIRDSQEERSDRLDMNLDMLSERLASMKNRGGVSISDAQWMYEATMKMVTYSYLENLGIGLELGKRKVKEMLFKEDGEGRLIGISGMSGSGKTTLAREIMRDEEVQGHFENRILFLTVSQSPNLEELKAIIWGFLTGYDSYCSATFQTRKLVILDDVWTRRSLDHLVFNMPRTTTLVVSRSKFADPKTSYNMELLNEDEATTLFCLSAFGQKSIPSGFNIKVVKQAVEECKGLPLALKVIGASLKDRPAKYWQGAVKRLSRGEPADETHESRVFAQMEATLETLDHKTKECFLDLGAFPEKKKIPLDVIITMWVQLHDLDEETAFAVLVDLSDKNLLIILKDPRLGTLYSGYYDIFVMLHDGLRYLALYLSNREIVSRRERLLMPKRALRLPREWERYNDEPYNARIVSIHTGEMSEMDWFDMELPKTEVLILNFASENYVLPPFIAKMSRLRVLVVVNNGMSFPHLHNFSSFTNLAKLRSLWLEMVHVPKIYNNAVPFKDLHKLSLIFCKMNNVFDQTTLDMTQIFPSLSDLTVDHCDDLLELPSTICGISSLNSISITNCPRFDELPKNMSKLSTLELLRLYACPELKSLPEDICELPSLKYLDISQCLSLSFLPKELGKLSTLEKIDMRDCPLLSIPSSAVLLTSLRHVICDKETLWMWEEVQKVVPGLLVEAAETWFSLD